MRRTRRLTRAQSKYGCLTCKARKVRCDETHPTCRRCTNSGFVCEGYTNTRPASPAQESAGASSSWSAFQVRPESQPAASPENDIQQKLIRFLLSSNIPSVGRGSLDGIIRTTTKLAPSSLTAIPALEILVQRDSSDLFTDQESRLRVDTAYGQAIRLFVDEIRQASGDFGTIFITGIILIAIELLQRRRQDAWKHLLGSRESMGSATSIEDRSEDISFLYRVYDLQTMVYSEGVRAPLIEPQSESGLESFEADTVSWHDLERCIVMVLHSAHALISSLHLSDATGTLPAERQVEEQVSHANVSLAMQFIEHKLSAEPGLDARDESAYLILRSLCLMTIMILEQIRSTDESVWDQYVEEFQSIVEAAETVQSRSSNPIRSSQDQGRLHMTLQLGLIAPLNLTALKYRHPLWRRRAATCLRKAGIEGPFIGRQLASMVERCMEIEESGTRQPSVSTPEAPAPVTRLDVRMPVEHKRVAHCWTNDDNGNADQTSWPRTAKGNTSIMFMTRKRPERVMAAKVFISPTFTTGAEYQAIQDKTLDTAAWNIWTETIPFDNSKD